MRQLNPPPFWHIAFLFDFVCIWWLCNSNAFRWILFENFVGLRLFLSLSRFLCFFSYFFLVRVSRFPLGLTANGKANRIKQKIHMCFRSFTHHRRENEEKNRYFVYFEDVDAIFCFHVQTTVVLFDSMGKSFFLPRRNVEHFWCQAYDSWKFLEKS